MKKETRQIVSGLLRYLKLRRQLHLLPEIVQELEKQAGQLAPENLALITSAYKLSDLERKLIKNQLESLFGRKLTLQLKVDPNIISGIVVRVADRVIDLTMSKDLEELTRKLKD